MIRTWAAAGVAALALISCGAVPSSQAATNPHLGAVLATIPVDADPQDIAFSADGKTAYVTTLTGQSVDLIDLVSMKVSRSLPLGFQGGSIEPYGDKLLVTNAAGNSIAFVDPASGSVAVSYAQLSGPISVAVPPGHRAYYIADTGTGSVLYVDDDQQYLGDIAVGGKPWGLAATPDGASVLAVVQSANTVAVIDTTSYAVRSSIAVGARPAYIAVSPDGAHAYVTEAGAAEVGVIDLATGAVTAQWPAGTTPWGIAVSPDGHEVYACDNAAGTLEAFDSVSGKLQSATPTGKHPDFVAVDPSGSRVLVANSGDNSVTILQGAVGAAGASSTKPGAGSTPANSANNASDSAPAGGSILPIVLVSALAAVVLIGAAVAIVFLLRRRPGTAVATDGAVATVATQHCARCGAEIRGTRFCESCGAPAA